MKRKREEGAPWKRADSFYGDGGDHASCRPCAARPCLDRDFKTWLLTQYAEGALSAKRICTGAYHLGDLATLAGVDHIARNPNAQSGSFAIFLDCKLGLDQFANNSVFMANIPQHTKTKGRQRLPHPFLLPHRQVDDFPDECACDKELWELPWADDFRVLYENGPLNVAVLRLYVDGVDTGGKSRKKAKKVLVFLWSPLGSGSSLTSRRLITVMLGDRCYKSCGCSGRCTVQAIWKVISWSVAALRARVNPDKGPFGEPLT